MTRVGPWRWLCSAILALAACACGSPDRVGPAADTGAATRVAGAGEGDPRTEGATLPASRSSDAGRPRIVFLGDSLTAGLGLAREDSFPARIQARLDAAGYRYEVINAGVSGDTSASGLGRLDWSLEGDVAVLVVELGANDGLRGLPVSQMRDNLSQIITRAKQRNITVILTGMEAPPNYGAAYTGEYRQVFPDLAREHGVRLVPFFLEGVAGVESLNQRDGIHPNPAGSRIVEQTVWRALEPELEKQDR